MVRQPSFYTCYLADELGQAILWAKYKPLVYHMHFLLKMRN